MNMGIRNIVLACLAVVAMAWVLVGCNDTGADDDTGAGDTASDGVTGDTGTDADEDVPPGDVVNDTPAEIPDGADVTADGSLCGNTQCSNCIDDDNDTLTDGFDPHCISAMDNDEYSFATAIPGDNRDDKWQDCFFDGNSGAPRETDCRFHTCCILRPNPCPEDLGTFNEAEDCIITEECIAYCLPAVTPGCDCFGCCTIYVEDVAYTVYTNPALAQDVDGDTEDDPCDLEHIADPDYCPTCTPTDDCDNPCVPEDCELCPGQTIDDLPEECTGNPPTCDDGVTPCETTADCPVDYYCSLGCCVSSVIIY